MSIRNFLMGSALAALTLCVPSVAVAQSAAAKPFTVPELRKWTAKEGTFTPSAQSRIIVASGNSELQAIAAQLSQDYTTLTGITPAVASGRAHSGDITLRIKGNKKANAEGYTLTITADGVTIEGPTAAGVRHGAMTLLQLTEQSPALPIGVAQDYPDYAIRGFMLDAGRKFIPMDYLYRLVDVMAYYKMNVLHVHLNDNGFKYYFDDQWDKTQAAFRLESEKFPGLTARDGSYTKDEFRALVKYAAAKGVEIIPEIDFPAHALAFTRYMPEIGSTDDLYGRDHLNILEPKTYEFLDTLLAEYMQGPDPVFAGPRVHIGTDEYSNRDSLVVEKFRYLTDRYIKYVKSFGKEPAIWGSLTHAAGKQPVESKDVLMYAWSTGYANPQDMIDAGYDMVSIPDGWVYIVPNAGYYYDYLNTQYLYEHYTPAVLGGDFTFQEKHPQIKGGMFAVWNDHPNNGITVKDIHHRVMAAIPTMAAKTWDGADVTLSYDDFAAKSASLSEAPGVNYLGRYGSQPGEVILEQASVAPGSTLAIPEIGYDYTVEFTINGAEEARGTKLFESPNAIFWISDPVTGLMGFSREDKLYTFRQNVLPGETLRCKITGNNRGTQLWVNDTLVDDLNTRWVSYNGGKNKMAEVRTLVFPLQKAGDFKSSISNLKVTNSIK
jgi:hexosaminidase